MTHKEYSPSINSPSISCEMVSFIIPTLNEEKNICRLLESVFKEKRNNNKYHIEVIVVDNGSKDKTVELAQKKGAIVLIDSKATIGGLRNRGGEIAKGDILIFCDADNILEKGTTNHVLSRLSCNDIGAVSPNGLIPYGNASWVERTWYWHTRKTEDDDEVKEVLFLGSGFLALRKKVFKQVNGFDEKLDVGEDSDLSRRIRENGYRLVQDRNLKVYNTRYPKTLREMIKREFWHGDSFRNLRIHKSIDPMTVYLVVIAMTMAIVLLCVVGLIEIKWIAIPLGLVIGPSFCKAFRRRGSFDRLFWQLVVLYCTYLWTRSFALFKRV
jgi:GT2 family glycosyltransferase